MNFMTAFQLQLFPTNYSFHCLAPLPFYYFYYIHIIFHLFLLTRELSVRHHNSLIPNFIFVATRQRSTANWIPTLLSKNGRSIRLYVRLSLHVATHVRGSSYDVTRRCGHCATYVLTVPASYSSSWLAFIVFWAMVSFSFYSQNYCLFCIEIRFFLIPRCFRCLTNVLS